jgi:hypothetical protein
MAQVKILVGSIPTLPIRKEFMKIDIVASDFVKSIKNKTVKAKIISVALVYVNLCIHFANKANTFRKISKFLEYSENIPKIKNTKWFFNRYNLTQ